MCHDVLFLSLCVFFWEVVKDLCERSKLSLYVPTKEYECLKVYNVCDGFVYCWVLMVGVLYIIKSE